ncbi:MAG: prolipoprotein diacylglyceryl transferase [Chloroflexota bacterium]|nr:prolipoprotein diacylglyceryl transferase [Chloroflexota bacterium]MDE3101874.1 prolipoprotein diacylglyceryl transferase [Chloroflexota bacterium]
MTTGVIDLPFDPILTIGAAALSWHSLFALTGMIVGALIGIRLGRPFFTFDQGQSIALTAIVGGLIGSRVIHVVDSWRLYAADPIQALAVWNGGAAITGGAIGGVLAGWWAARRARVPAGRALDAGSVGLGVGMAIGRIGDIISGEHHATACVGLPWCVRYTNAHTLGQTTPVHPAVEYELLWDLACAAVVLWLLPRADRLRLDGRLIFVFLGLYGVGRFALGAVRLDPPWLFGLQQSQLTSLFFVAALVVAIATRPRGART